MKNYEDKIYSLGETVTGQTQAMSQAIQKTLENNGGVGIMTGYYDQNLSILSVSNLLLHSTGYTFDTFMEQTKGSLRNFFYDEPRHYFPVFSVRPVTWPVSAPLQSHLRNIFCLHNFSFYKNPLSVLCLLHLAFICIQKTCPC